MAPKRIFLLASLCFSLSSLLESAGANENKNEIQNVLFIISDDLKASALGCYGNMVCKTPNIDRLASRGVVFDRAYCQGTWCLPSRLSIMFGRYRGFSKGLPNIGGHPSFAELLKNHAWHTARVGKIYHMRVPGDIVDGTNGPDHEPSWTERFNCSGREAHTPGSYALLNKNIFTTELEGRESTGDPNRMFVAVKTDGDGSDQPDFRAASKAIELLNHNKNRSFLLAVGFVRPHYPMVAPSNCFDAYPHDKIRLPTSVQNDLDDIPAMGRAKTLTESCGLGSYPENQQRMWAAYYASVTFMDEQVGRVLAELDRLGLTDKTAVVFTSDHGYHLGEHEFWQKSNLHEEVTRVPLIIAVPDKKSGRSSAMAELVDIYPTITELVRLPKPDAVQGSSLVPILNDLGVTVRTAAFSIKGNSYSLRTADWAYMFYRNKNLEIAEELYDMNNDPGQFHNLASDDAHFVTLNGFRNRLALKLEAIR